MPPGQTDLDASIALANNPSAGLVPGDPWWPTWSTPTARRSGTRATSRSNRQAAVWKRSASQFTQMYHVAPIPGQWELVLEWHNPVVGDELNDAFTGSIAFNQVSVSSDLPDSPSASVPALTSTAFDVNVENTGVAPEAFFVDPRLDNQTETVNLPNQNPAVTATSFTIPLPGGLSFPYYLVPTHTTQLQANVSSADGTTPVTFDMEYFPGDPWLSPAVASPGVTGTFGPGSASLTFTADPEVSPGFGTSTPTRSGPTHPAASRLTPPPPACQPLRRPSTRP